MRWWLVLVAACSPGPRAATPPDASPPDAAIDAAPWCDKVDLVPITVSGSSPDGSLAAYHFASARFSWECWPGGWAIVLWNDDTTACGRTTTLEVRMQDPRATTSPGSYPAAAIVGGAYTDLVTFEATTLDPSTLHFSGRFVSHDPAWSFDIPVDMQADDITQSCTL